MTFFKATAYGRSELADAFAEYERAHGRERAIAALEASTGAKSVADVPQDKVVCGLAELICNFSFVGRSAHPKSQAIADSLASIHAKLSAIRERTFSRGKQN